MSNLTPEKLARALAAALLCGLVLAAPLAAGGTRVGLKVLLAVPALAALLLVATERAMAPPGERGLRLPWTLWAPILLALFYALQLVPIPPDLLAFLSPAAAARRADLPTVEVWAPLSLDAPATAVGLVLQAAFAATAVAAFALSRPRQAWILRSLAAAGAVVALIGFVHWVAGAHTLYGIYPLRHIDHLTGFFGTFVNNNTLAGFEVLTGLVALGLLARAEGSRAQAAALAAVVLCFSAALLAGSRGGHAALGLGIVFFTVFAHAGMGSEPWRRRARLASYAALGLGGLGVAAALMVLPEWSVATLAQLETDGKVAAWQAALPLARDFWITGSGRDAFSFVYPAYQNLAVSGTISHPENHLLHSACEAGLPGLLLGIGGGVAAVLMMLPGLARRGSATDWGMVAGLSACGLQQLVDFGFEAAGLALPVAALLGIGLARAVRRREKAPLPPRRWTAPGLALVAALALALLAWRGPLLPELQADAIQARLAAAPVAERNMLLHEHPADYLLTLTLADAHAQSGAPLGETLGWINRSLARFPRVTEHICWLPVYSYGRAAPLRPQWSFAWRLKRHPGSIPVSPPRRWRGCALPAI